MYAYILCIVRTIHSVYTVYDTFCVYCIWYIPCILYMIHFVHPHYGGRFYGSERVCVFIMHKTKGSRGQESIKTERYMANLHWTCPLLGNIGHTKVYYFPHLLLFLFERCFDPRYGKVFSQLIQVVPACDWSCDWKQWHLMAKSTLKLHPKKEKACAMSSFAFCT